MPTTNVALTTAWTPIAYGPTVGTGTISGHVNPIEIWVGTSAPSASDHGFKSFDSDPYYYNLVSGETLYARAIGKSGLGSAIVNRKEQPILLSNQTGGLNMTSVTIRATSGQNYTIRWGDGSVTNFVADGTENAYTHNYSTLDLFVVDLIGDLSKVSRFFANTQAWVEGNIGWFSAFPNLETLRLYATSFGGSIADIKNLPLLILTANSSLISGDIVTLSPTLLSVQIYSTMVSGDVASLARLPSATTLNVHTSLVDSYTPTTLPAWSSSQIRIHNLGLSAFEIDSFLIDLDAAGGTSGNARMDGTNAARTTVSDVAYNSLIGKGWVITVN